MELTPFIVFIIVALMVAFHIYKERRQLKREQYIEAYHFPEKVGPELSKIYPKLSVNQQQEVIRGLRDYFQVCLKLGRKPVAMPSKVVDLAWHEFILFTKAYQIFCGQAFGRFLHHTPAEAMNSQRSAQQGIKNCWRGACELKNINPVNPKKIPLLFAIDKKLNVQNGFKYTLNCHKTQGGLYCASHIGCGSCGAFNSCSSCDSGCSGCGD